MMKTRKIWAWTIAGLALFAGIGSQVYSQHGPGKGKGRGMGRGPGHDTQFAVDRDDFHFLLENHEKIQRTVKNTDSGVESVTESDTPSVAARLQKHVRAMYARVDEKRPIRMRDPLYAEIFRNADKIKLAVENTEKGIRVTHSSTDPYAVKLIQAHAKVVSGFAKHGFEEAHKNHAVPGKTLTTDQKLGCCKDGQCKDGQCKEGQCKEGQCKEGQRKDGQCKDGQCKEGQCKEEKCKEGQCKGGQCKEGQRKEGQRKDGQCKDGQCKEGQCKEEQCKEEQCKEEQCKEEKCKEEKCKEEQRKEGQCNTGKCKSE